MTGALRWSGEKVEDPRLETVSPFKGTKKDIKKLNLFIVVEMALCICNLPILANTDKASIPGIQRE
jgi:hypothetical protein